MGSIQVLEMFIFLSMLASCSSYTLSQTEEKQRRLVLSEINQLDKNLVVDVKNY